jgi:hypothetical protein
MKSIFKNFIANVSKLTICVEWLLEVWALVRGLLILSLVVVSIIKSLDVSQLQNPIIDLLSAIATMSK